MPELAEDGDGLHRERFVQLEEIDVVERPAGLLQRRCRTASTGVISTNFGARPLVAWPTMRASGVEAERARALGAP